MAIFAPLWNGLTQCPFLVKCATLKRAFKKECMHTLWWFQCPIIDLPGDKAEKCTLLGWVDMMQRFMKLACYHMCFFYMCTSMTICIFRQYDTPLLSNNRVEKLSIYVLYSSNRIFYYCCKGSKMVKVDQN